MVYTGDAEMLNEDKLLWSTVEVCARLGISRDTWRKVLKNPDAPKAVKFGERDLRYRACDVQELLARRAGKN